MGSQGRSGQSERQIYFGPLKSLIISRQMQHRYNAALLMCQEVMSIFCPGLDMLDVVELDRARYLFLKLAWEEGEPMSLAGDAISGLQHAINRRRVFLGAWRYFSAW